MLQSKTITKLLKQSLKPIPQQNESLAQPLAVSLLSPEGIPLVTSTNTPSILTNDTIKIYSLIARHSLVSGWTIVQFEDGIKGIVSTIDCGRVDTGASDAHIEIIPGSITDDIEHDEDKRDDVLFVVLFYDSTVTDAVAKVKIDSLVGALNDGLKGYLRS
ncbi:uncharacterized protein SPAPADRAFT_63573 [Spathaspora passalidarum NRRL Y-27907]|uniref:Uncharacterized protein n=1 Tax=Spathaspora passalidarum (strain NRRL Y-27907 / 11-Y1) TaxID=619300 RepID=G3AVJ8_SPAPN|nr:uncharacterized protein SPAPADRAFT_63573 [Spathaspora passalidarum NRRL Y-27907]EGW29947.1 hypothetical protein SPAPADRAFT_63573 [Spathaspora passalidarum NRRL Y-27907]